MTENVTRYFAETVAEELETRGWSRAELARRAGWTEDELAGVLSPSGYVGEDAARRLGEAFGTSAAFWRNLWEADERSRVAEYDALVADGLSDYEARGTAWPEVAT